MFRDKVCAWVFNVNIPAICHMQKGMLFRNWIALNRSCVLLNDYVKF